MSWIWTSLTRGSGLPAVWRGPVFALLFWRPWPVIVVGLIVSGALMAVSGGSTTVVSTLQLYGALAIALAMTSGSVSRDVGSDRQLILFQRPGAMAGHYVRLWILAYGCTLAAISLVWAVAQPFAGAGASVGGHVLAGSLLFATMVFATGALATTLVRTGEVVLVIAWTIAPVIVAVLAERYLLGQMWRAALEAPFVPFNAVFELQQAMASGNWATWEIRWVLQLPLYPAICISLAVFRLKRLARNGVS